MDLHKELILATDDANESKMLYLLLSRLVAEFSLSIASEFYSDTAHIFRPYSLLYSVYSIRYERYLF